ncbi:bacillithiol biosynthesis cysteine-adding enzyme BshC [Paenibacillus sp. MBLB2552]|uniref:Putative cysteine ligase BshC n=1 Tax=Paenibacillus mellifer TaxID=2937794 RepID=A0A9X1XY77_9BACL|nr:bacillithiol biosynthesis cysteine-adding enzyme BshC [Paenibacillus mellifer]MCK8487845.1 bacillithiol biosynthesis cysteine-adding enzyme BshC [Paenibacillus mellifer]
MNVVQEQLSFAGPLAEVYVNQFSAVELLYESDPGQSESWAERAAWLDQTEHTRVDRKALAARLREYNGRYNSDPAVERAIAQLEQPGTAVIVGGQQSGLFTGPLLVVYKAVTILKAAKVASDRLKRPVVPVFWIAGEDHDWDEVNHAYVLSPDLQVRRIRLHRGAMDRLPVSFTKVTAEAWEKAVSELEQLLPDSEHKAGILELVRCCKEDADNLTAYFAKLMGALFGKHGLVLLDSSDPELRRLEVPVFERMIRQNDELEMSYHETVRDMAGLGYEPSAEVVEGGANLFYISERERLLLFKRNGRFEDRKGKVTFTADELLGELREHPERFSNNVLTRPLMQDSLLPVLGSVLGPGEIAYWGLTRKAFHKLGLKMPLLLPREAFTVVDGTLQKYMEKYQISWNDVKDPEVFQRKRETWLASQERMQVDQRFNEVIAAFGELYEPLLEELSGVQSGLSRLGAVNRDKILDQIEYLRGKAKDALEKIHETGLRHFDRIQLSLFPLNKPQERVYNLFEALNRYGLDWIEELMDIPYELTGKHRIIYL